MIRRCSPLIELAIVALALVLCTVLGRADEVFPVAHTDTVTVRILDGRTGGPQRQKRVLLVGGYDLRDLDELQWREEAVTDLAGEIHLSNALRNLPYLRVQVLKSHACEPNAKTAAVNVDLVRSQGQSRPNHCGFVSIANDPGVLNVFIKGKPGAPSVSSPGTLNAQRREAKLSESEPLAAETPKSIARFYRPLPEPLKEPESKEASPAPAAKSKPMPVENPVDEAAKSIAPMLSYPFDSSYVELPPPPPAPIVVTPRVTRAKADHADLEANHTSIPSKAVSNKDKAGDAQKRDAKDSKAQPKKEAAPAQDSKKPASTNAAQPEAATKSAKSTKSASAQRADAQKQSDATADSPSDEVNKISVSRRPRFSRRSALTATAIAELARSASRSAAVQALMSATADRGSASQIPDAEFTSTVPSRAIPEQGDTNPLCAPDLP